MRNAPQTNLLSVFTLPASTPTRAIGQLHFARALLTRMPDTRKIGAVVRAPSGSGFAAISMDGTAGSSGAMYRVDRVSAGGVGAWIAILAACLLGVVKAAGAADAIAVGFSTNKPPYVIEATSSGIEVDIITAAGRAAELVVKPSFAPMTRLARMLERGEVDAIATTNQSDSGDMHFSAEYVEYQNAVVALASRKLRIERIADLGMYSVSTFQRAQTLLGPEFGQMAANNPRYREEAEQIVRNRLLYSGRGDVVVGDRRIVEYFNREISAQVDTAQPVTWYALFPPTRYRVGFRNPDVRDRFNSGLAAIRKNGEYAAIMKRYAAY